MVQKLLEESSRNITYLEGISDAHPAESVNRTISPETFLPKFVFASFSHIRKSPFSQHGMAENSKTIP